MGAISIHDWLLTQYHNLSEFHIAYSIIGATIVAIVGADWTLYQYIVTRRIEVRQPFLNKQLELYFRTAAVVGNFAILKPNTQEWRKNERDFWELYWSELSIVESNQVEKAMINVGEALKYYKADPTNDKKKRNLTIVYTN